MNVFTSTCWGCYKSLTGYFYRQIRVWAQTRSSFGIWSLIVAGQIPKLAISPVSSSLLRSFHRICRLGQVAGRIFRRTRRDSRAPE